MAHSAAMVRQVVRHGLSMREVYTFPRLAVGGWFPRHMNRGMLQVQGKLHGVDGVVEVHDARIPLSGRNPTLTDIGIIRPSVLVMNKIDMIDSVQAERLRKYFEREVPDTTVLFTNCKASKDKELNRVVNTMTTLLDDSTRFNRAEQLEMNLLVIGIPNVGKSSVINALRNANMRRKSQAEVAPRPGVTKHVMERTLISWKPRTYVRDTPGILSPRIVSVESGLKLALTNTVINHVVDPSALADYLLFWLNKRGRHQYAKALDLKEPMDDITKLLGTIALKKQYTFTKRDHCGTMRTYPNYIMSANHFVESWRKGQFGCQLLDDVPY